MALTCGLPLNNAMASAVNMLGDVHRGAGEQAVEPYREVETAGGPDGAARTVARWRATRGRYLAGFAHRFHTPVDPRAPRRNRRGGGVRARGGARGAPVPMYIDGATAAIVAKRGVEPPLARGLFCLSRSVGIRAHAWEQTQTGARNTGPTPTIPLRTCDGPTDASK